MSDIWTRAVLAHQEGNFAGAKQLYEQVLQDAKDSDDTASQVVIQYHLARLALDHEGVMVAMHRFKKLLRLQEKLGDSSGVSRTLRDIADLYEQQDEMVEAIRHAERAFTSAKEVWDQEQMAASLHLLGVLYQYADMHSQSITAMREGQKTWEELGNVVAWQNTTMVYADILEEQENFPLCIRELKRLIKTLDPREDLEDIAGLHFRVATLYGRLQDFRGSLMHMLACLSNNRTLQSDLIQRDAMVIQDIRHRLGDPEFQVLIEQKMNPTSAQGFLLWLDDLFPPEHSDPLMEQLPQPEHLASPTEEITSRPVPAPTPAPKPTPRPVSVETLPPPPKSTPSATPRVVPEPDPIPAPAPIPVPEPVTKAPVDEPMSVDDLLEELSALENTADSLPTEVEEVSDPSIKRPTAVVDWEAEEPEHSDDYTNTTNTQTGIEDWTVYTESVDLQPPNLLPMLLQHFAAAMVGAMGVLWLLQLLI